MDTVVFWIANHRMELLVGAILIWSMLVRLSLGAVGGARMGLFAAPPVVLITWMWILELNLMQFDNRFVLLWWTTALGYLVGTILDVKHITGRLAASVSLGVAAIAVVVQANYGSFSQTGSMHFADISWRGQLGIFLMSLTVVGLVVWRNRNGAQGASVARYVTSILFALGVAYMMRLQGFSTDHVLVVGLIAVHLVVPTILGGLEAGWLQSGHSLATTQRPSFPGWAGILGLLVPLYLTPWIYVTSEANIPLGTLGLRPITLLSLLVFADFLLRPARTYLAASVRYRLGLGSRTFFITISCGILFVAILVQQVQRDLSLAV